MTITHPPVVGIFNNSSMAEHAIEELKDAGFSDEEIQYSGQPAKKNVLKNIKSKLKGGEPQSREEIVESLMDMGVPEEAAHRCASEFAAGHPIVAVKSPGHEQDAITILRSNGGRSYNALGTMSGPERASSNG